MIIPRDENGKLILPATLEEWGESLIKYNEEQKRLGIKNEESETRTIEVRMFSYPKKETNEFKDGMAKMTDDELVATFNGDVGNPGWVSARGRFHAAIREEFVSRGFDFSAVGSICSLSFAKKILLIGKKIMWKEDND